MRLVHERSLILVGSLWNAEVWLKLATSRNHGGGTHGGVDADAPVNCGCARWQLGGTSRQGPVKT
jgi:hypothetical protein